MIDYHPCPEFARMKPKLIIAISAVILCLIILIQNTQVVVVKLLFWELSMSQIILIGLTLLLGICFGFILATFFSYRTEKRKGKGTF
jgi:uncharacterized integral membrane protein